MQAYSDKSRESDPMALPDIEVFHSDDWGDTDNPIDPGFYWWSCFPGCLPDSDPFGPFDTEEEALADARADLGFADDDEPDEPDEPDQGDYLLAPSGQLGQYTSVSAYGEGHVGEYDTTEEALAAVRDRMKRERFYPNVWWVSDHGNCWQIDLDGNEIK